MAEIRAGASLNCNAGIMISHFRLSETGWDISFFLSFFLWERGFRRDINVYKVIKFKPGEERKRKKTGISTDRRRRTYIWVRDDQQLYRKHFFKNEQYTQRFRRCFPWPYNEKRMKCWMNFPIKTACLIIKDPPVVVFCFVLYLVERLLL